MVQVNIVFVGYLQLREYQAHKDADITPPGLNLSVTPEVKN